MITTQQLSAALGISGSRASIFVEALNRAMVRFEINTTTRVAMFIAQIGWESNKLSSTSENLNYSEAGLATNFSHHFDSDEEMARYAHKPEAIANRVYANRMGNGNENSGDGWRYRGAGLIQLTGKANQAACALFFGVPMDTVGDWLRTAEGASMSAAWYWKLHGCNELADKNDFVGITKAINGGLNGINERLGLLAQVNQGMGI